MIQPISMANTDLSTNRVLSSDILYLCDTQWIANITRPDYDVI